MKYQVGDKVRLRRDLIVGELYGEFYYVDGMAEAVKAGDVVTIKERHVYSYSLLGYKYPWWTDEMFEGLAEPEPSPTLEPSPEPTDWFDFLF